MVLGEIALRLCIPAQLFISVQENTEAGAVGAGIGAVGEFHIFARNCNAAVLLCDPPIGGVHAIAGLHVILSKHRLSNALRYMKDNFKGNLLGEGVFAGCAVIDRLCDGGELVALLSRLIQHHQLHADRLLIVVTGIEAAVSVGPLGRIAYRFDAGSDRKALVNIAQRDETAEVGKPRNCDLRIFVFEDRGHDRADAGIKGLRQVDHLAPRRDRQRHITDDARAVDGDHAANLVALGTGGDLHGVGVDCAGIIRNAHHIAGDHNRTLRRPGGGGAGDAGTQVEVLEGQRSAKTHFRISVCGGKGDCVFRSAVCVAGLEEEAVAHVAGAGVGRPDADGVIALGHHGDGVNLTVDGLAGSGKDKLGVLAVHGALLGK